MAYHVVTLEDSGLQFRCRDDENMLVGMRYHGPDGVQVGCRGGGCGVCRVQVLSGTYTAKKMSKAHITEDDLGHKIVLSCRIFPTSDLSIRLCPKPQHSDQSATSTDHLTNQ
ncbi:MAG: 2Fe-2S iron-sulfur cluster-binding protein [Ilumatobacteraceae bacterium]